VTKRTLGLLGFGVVVLVVGFFLATSSPKARTSNVTMQVMEPVDAQLAAKAEEGCWFKVRNRSSRTDERRQWSSVSSTGAKTEKLGELLIVTGAMEPAVGDDHFYGCSLFQYTQGSPLVMSVTTAPVPVRVDNVIPFGFAKDGKKLQE
jgi:hypothetical protein